MARLHACWQLGLTTVARYNAWRGVCNNCIIHKLCINIIKTKFEDSDNEKSLKLRFLMKINYLNSGIFVYRLSNRKF